LVTGALARTTSTTSTWMLSTNDILNHMVLYRAGDPRAVDQVFGALADPTRRAILGRLSQGEASVSELAEPFDLSLPAIAKHVRVLERAGLLTHRKTGRVRRCRIAADRLRLASDWLDTYRQFWRTRLDALADHLESGEDA
jgi:DNA-binding transcriptional ArsR family regulator